MQFVHGVVLVGNDFFNEIDGNFAHFNLHANAMACEKNSQVEGVQVGAYVHGQGN